MTSRERADRFAELDAARALGDLSPEELAEWQHLVDEHGFEPDAELDLLVAGLEGTLATAAELPPAALRQRLEANAADFAAEAPANVIPFWRNAALGWAVAAGFAILLVMQVTRPTADPVAPAEARTALLTDTSAVRLDFAGLADFAGLNGDVVWSDTTQTGYMRFAGLPANDPTQTQYQLWIVDPERDERPVDGGVFDIPAGGGEVIIPIHAALRVDEPVAFVITVEKPGGVVVSAQETVAAIAQRG